MANYNSYIGIYDANNKRVFSNGGFDNIIEIKAKLKADIMIHPIEPSAVQRGVSLGYIADHIVRKPNEISVVINAGLVSVIEINQNLDKELLSGNVFNIIDRAAHYLNLVLIGFEPVTNAQKIEGQFIKLDFRQVLTSNVYFQAIRDAQDNPVSNLGYIQGNQINNSNLQQQVASKNSVIKTGK